MNWKRLIKSVIGTGAIYGVLVAFLFLLSKTGNLGLGELWVFPVSCVVCSIVAGLLFKGELYAAVWLAATAVFFAVMWGFPTDWNFETFGIAFLLLLAPLLFPFFIAKSVFLSRKLEDKEKAGAEQENNIK